MNMSTLLYDFSSEEDPALVNEPPDEEQDPASKAHSDQDAVGGDECQSPDEDGGGEAEAGYEH